MPGFVSSKNTVSASPKGAEDKMKSRYQVSDEKRIAGSDQVIL